MILDKSACLSDALTKCEDREAQSKLLEDEIISLKNELSKARNEALLNKEKVKNLTAELGKISSSKETELKKQLDMFTNAMEKANQENLNVLKQKDFEYQKIEDEKRNISTTLTMKEAELNRQLTECQRLQNENDSLKSAFAIPQIGMMSTNHSNTALRQLHPSRFNNPNTPYLNLWENRATLEPPYRSGLLMPTALYQAAVRNTSIPNIFRAPSATKRLDGAFRSPPFLEKVGQAQALGNSSLQSGMYSINNAEAPAYNIHWDAHAAFLPPPIVIEPQNEDLLPAQTPNFE